MNEITRTKPPNTRPTIGLLTGRISDELGASFLAGVTDAAEERDANLITFAGGSLRSPHGFEAQGNVLYDLVAARVVDGLVVDGGLLGHYVGSEALQDFCGRYRDLPVVSVEVPVEGIPSVLVDFYQGMRHVVTHLIEVHGCRRIAFICGPEESLTAEERYRAYKDALAEHDIPLDMDLVAPGTFFEPSGEEAVRLLLEERKVAFEAVAAANDFMAMDALQALQARGVLVPGDVAVTGFDDFGVASVVTPPLTTARLGNYERARRAAEMLLAQLEGEEVPERVVFPAELVVRRSCGCPSLAVVEAAAEPVVGHSAGETFEEALVTRREGIVAAMAQAVGGYSAEAAPATTFEWAGQLLDGFAAAMGDESSDGFLSTLDQVLRRVVAAGDVSSIGPSGGSERSVAAWQGAISALRRQVLPWLSAGEVLSWAENLWQQARVFIGEAAGQVQSYQQLQAGRQTEMLQEVGRALITTFDVDELMDVMARELPRLGIPGCYLSLYERRPELAEGGQEMPPQESRLILAYGEDGRIELEPEGRRFSSRELVPDGMLPQERCYSMVVEGLYFADHQLGFALFEVGPRDGVVYEVLRGQISSALQGALLLRERQQAEEALERAYVEVEKQVEERTAELGREIVERERLQQEVIEAQKRALQELSTPIIPIMERIIVMPLIGSIDSLRARDITRALLAGIREHHAKVVILDITGVSVVDSGVAAHLNKTIQAARLKGAHTIVTGISDAVAETIVDLGIDWGGIETLGDLQTGLRTALATVGLRIER